MVVCGLRLWACWKHATNTLPQEYKIASPDAWSDWLALADSKERIAVISGNVEKVDRVEEVIVLFG